MGHYILALDQGTSSSRAILFDREGNVRGAAQQEFPQHYPQPGWVEHDPEEIWSSQLNVVREALLHGGIQAKDIAAIGIANQRETTLLWERSSGRPVGNAIVWQDRRTAERCSQLKEDGFEPLIRNKTGLVIDSYFSATKLSWLLEQDPTLRKRAERGELAFGTVDSFLVWRLSGGAFHVTDPSNASRTMLYDIDRMEWSDELLDLFQVPRAVLPEVVPSSSIVGHTDLFGDPIPIAGLAGDQQAATFGQACFEPGLAKNTYGTGCFLLMNQGPLRQAIQPGLLGTVGWQIGDSTPMYAAEGSVFVAGAAIQWLRDELGILGSSYESEALARSVPDTAGIVFVPAFVGLGAPHWDSSARGMLIGLTRGSGRAHVVRAALESIAFQTRDVIEEMQKGAGPRISELRVDGGASSNDFLMQFQADILGIPVVRPSIIETTALGAAYLAGLAVGFWECEAEIARHWRAEHRLEPTCDEDERETRYFEWMRAVKRAQGWEAKVI